MLITDKLIYLEMEKTASTYINYLLSECFHAKCVGKHNIIGNNKCVSSYLPNNISQKFIFGSIRNPWDWYVSLWAQGCNKSGLKGGLFKTLTSKKLLSRNFLVNDIGKYQLSCDTPLYVWREFRKPTNTWLQLYSDNQSPKLFRTWLKLLYEEDNIYDLTRLWATYPKSHLKKIVGLMSYRYCFFFTKSFLSRQTMDKIKNFESLKEFEMQNNILDGIVRTEFVERDLLGIIKNAGYQVDRKTELSILKSNTNRKNASDHYDTSYYYDDETIDLVARKEKLIIEKFGYSPPNII